MLVLSLISLLCVLNKLIGSICSGRKQARTQGSMIEQENIDFEANTHVGRHWNHAQCFKYIMLSNCLRLSDGELGLSATRLSDGKWG